MDNMGVFIKIEIDNDRINPDQSIALVKICPVDIFTIDSNLLMVASDQEDECTLCERCLEIADPGAIVIHKKYSDELLCSHG
jgi:dissimilatory sulfite reductase (desulfoviridin) alpha/beta subunit